ncbi:hypothetical protein LWQ05_001492 [Salmonella enterica]|nr:hypothetical protein [Salmonella enterica]
MQVHGAQLLGDTLNVDRAGGGEPVGPPSASGVERNAEQARDAYWRQ